MLHMEGIQHQAAYMEERRYKQNLRCLSKERIYNKAAYIHEGRSVGGFRHRLRPKNIARLQHPRFVPITRLNGTTKWNMTKNAHFLGVFFLPNKKIS